MSKKVSKISVHNLNKKFRPDFPSLRILAQKILEKEKTKAAVNLIFINNSYMKKLNSKFRGKNKTTDVLSFPLESDLKGDSAFLGEVYVSFQQAQRQAKEYGVSLQKELQRLVAHGVLHLLGYDHQTKKEASEMRKKEEKYLKLTS